jgi:carbonic anhydrase/acetyltransferase-like protein (isoleucine patch superfamily)
MIGDDVTIGRSVVAGARLTIAANGSLGYAAQVGTDVTIGAGAVVGNLVTLGDFATLGDNAVVSRNVTISDGINSGDGASVNGVVGPDVAIAAGARIEQGARVRKQADIGAGAAVESSGRVGRGAVIEAGATVFGRVAANATVGAGATVEAGATVARGGEVCAGNTLPSGSQVLVDGTWPVEGCTLTGTSCQSIKDSAPSAPDGVYTIDPDGTGGAAEFDAYCDMTTDAAYGWTLCYSATQSLGNVTVNGWQERFNTTALGVGEYARDCKAITSDTGASVARVQYLDGSGTIWAELSPAPSLANGNYYEFIATSGSNNVGIEISNSANPGRGHCFDNAAETNSWGRAGLNASCFLNTSTAGWYFGLTHVEYWVR